MGGGGKCGGGGGERGVGPEQTNEGEGRGKQTLVLNSPSTPPYWLRWACSKMSL